MKILIVDDDKYILDLGLKTMEKEGWEVLTASSGVEALGKFEKEKYALDLITLDILLPDIDGIKILRTMKEKCPRLPIFMLTAYDYRDFFEVYVSEMYIVKSSDSNPFKEVIDTYAKILRNKKG